MAEASSITADDIRIVGQDPLVPPDYLATEISASQSSLDTVLRGRREAVEILKQRDDRLLVIVGPCSLHDPATVLEYCSRLVAIAERLQDDLCVIMRAYLEKPRTVVGWKGLTNDPDLDESYQINKGLKASRIFFCDLTAHGMPVASEMLDTISPQFLADLILLGAIGARTTESQLHRELASGLSFPVGFENGTDGSLDVALEREQQLEREHRIDIHSIELHRIDSRYIDLHWRITGFLHRHQQYHAPRNGANRYTQGGARPVRRYQDRSAAGARDRVRSSPMVSLS